MLAYAGLRPSEALALHWSDVRAQTILVQRALSLGEDADTKTHQHRTVRLLAPLRDDLELWRGSTSGNQLVFPGHDGEPWKLPAYQSWRRRAFRRAFQGAGVDHTTPYALRHSFASLLLQRAAA